MTEQKSEKLPFNAWELAVIEVALRFYADHYGLNSALTQRQVRALADRIGGANLDRYPACIRTAGTEATR